MGARAIAKRLSPGWWALVAVLGAVLIGNLLYLTATTDPNPIGPDSGLLTSFQGAFASGAPSIDPSAGAISQALGHRAATDILSLHAPWWNPYEGTGGPLAGEIESAALFPPTLLTALSNGQLWERMLLEVVAGMATYFLLRRLELSAPASIAGAVAFALNGAFAWLWHAAFNPIAFLPLLLLGIEHAYAAARAGRRGGWWLIGVAGALSVYAGFPETAYIDTVLAVLWFGWRCVEIPRRALVALLRKAAAGATLAVLLSGPLLVAMVGFLNVASLGPNQTGAPGAYHLPLLELPQVLMPYIYGPIFAYADSGEVLTNLWGSTGGYVSSALLSFAVIGLFSRGRRGLRVMLAVWVLLAFSRMYGQVPLLGHVIGWLPGMAQTDFYRFATAALELAVIVLAALGIDDLVKVPEHRRRLLWVGLGMLVVVSWGAIEAHGLVAKLGSGHHQTIAYAASVAWGLALPALAVWLGARRSRVSARALGGIVALDALLLFAAPTLSAVRGFRLDPGPVTYLQAHLGYQRFVTLGPLQPNYGSYYGLAALNINDNPVPSLYAQFVHAKLDPYVRTTVFVGNSGGDRPPSAPSPRTVLLRYLKNYRAAGVAFVLAPTFQPLPPGQPGLTLVQRTASTLIYRLSGAAPFMSAGGCSVRTDSFSQGVVSCRRPERPDPARDCPPGVERDSRRPPGRDQPRGRPVSVSAAPRRLAAGQLHLRAAGDPVGRAGLPRRPRRAGRLCLGCEGEVANSRPSQAIRRYATSGRPGVGRVRFCV